ncbi:ATP-binding protein [Gottfriedia sp. NPDC056225]|uniref:sensor histidine kinase n=1 Tax=Gottfriedia sp. NPDC056225 TaxID=3345751 RepID=UPI0035E215E1
MVMLVIVLGIMGITLFWKNYQNEALRWSSYLAFVGMFGGIGTLLGRGMNRPEYIKFADAFFTSTSHFFVPYTSLIFGFLYTGIIKENKLKRICKVLFLLPVIYMYFHIEYYPDFKVNFKVISTWAVPYMFICISLLAYTALKENNPIIKQKRILTCIYVIPMISMSMITNFILEAFGVVGTWDFFNPLIIGVQFLLFVYYGIRYGILGVKIRIENDRSELMVKSAVSGTAVFNHTIKNEIAKIDFLIEQLEGKIVENDKETLSNMNLTKKSINHIIDLSTRVQSQLDVVDFKIDFFWINDVIEESIILLTPLLREIIIHKDYKLDYKLKGDSVHFREMLLNILKNAIEAIKGSGKITINVYRDRKYIYVDIIDTGAGISKENMSLVLNPFFSTKGKVDNYGLGLTYCFNVMQRLNGKLLIRSKLHNGTAVMLKFPINRKIEFRSIIG